MEEHKTCPKGLGQVDRAWSLQDEPGPGAGYGCLHRRGLQGWFNNWQNQRQRSGRQNEFVMQDTAQKAGKACGGHGSLHCSGLLQSTEM